MSAVTQSNWPDGREVVRCECGLIQFKSASGLCVKSICRKPYIPPKPPETLLQDAPITKVVNGDIAQYVPNKNALSHLPAMFKVLRAAAGMSQPQISKLLGVPRTYISKIENAKCTPNLKSFERLCYTLGISIEGVLYLCEQAS